MNHLIVLENADQAAYLLGGRVIGRYHRSLVNPQGATLLLVGALSSAPLTVTRVTLHADAPADLAARHTALLRSPVGHPVDAAALAALLSVPGQVPGTTLLTGGGTHWSGMGLTVTEQQPSRADAAYFPCGFAVARRASLN